MALGLGKTSVVALNRETYVWSLVFVLDHMWPGVSFKVEMSRDYARYIDIIRIRVPCKNGDLMYVTQEVNVEDVEITGHPPKLSEQTIATITLLLR